MKETCTGGSNASKYEGIPQGVRRELEIAANRLSFKDHLVLRGFMSSLREVIGGDREGFYLNVTRQGKAFRRPYPLGAQRKFLAIIAPSIPQSFIADFQRMTHTLTHPAGLRELEGLYPVSVGGDICVSCVVANDPDRLDYPQTVDFYVAKRETFEKLAVPQPPPGLRPWGARET